MPQKFFRRGAFADPQIKRRKHARNLAPSFRNFRRAQPRGAGAGPVSFSSSRGVKCAVKLIVVPCAPHSRLIWPLWAPTSSPGPVQGHAGSFGGRKAAAGIGNCEQYMPRIRAFGNMADGKMHRAGICGPNRAFEQQAQNVAKIAANPAVKLGSAGGIYQPRPMPAFSAAGATASWASRKRCCRLKLTSECLGAWFWNNRRAADNFGHPLWAAVSIFSANLRAAGGRAQLSRGRAFAHDLVKRRAGTPPFSRQSGLPAGQGAPAGQESSWACSPGINRKLGSSSAAASGIRPLLRGPDWARSGRRGILAQGQSGSSFRPHHPAAFPRLIISPFGAFGAFFLLPYFSRAAPP